MDLFSSDIGALQDGSMRNSRQAAASSAIYSHNQALAAQAAGQYTSELGIAKGQEEQLKQAQSGQKTQQIIGGVMNSYMDAKGLKEGLSTYKDYLAKGKSKAAQVKGIVSDSSNTRAPVNVSPEPETAPSQPAPANTTSDPAPTATPEGAAAQGTSDTTPSAVEHNAITTGEDGQGKSGSMISKGLSRVTGLGEDTVDKIGKGVGALGSATVAGLDIYEDVKRGKLGDNGWEDAGQVGQIGGAIADTVGVFFPPAAALGGVLSLFGGLFSDIGEAVEGSKPKAVIPPPPKPVPVVDTDSGVAAQSAAVAAPRVQG